MGNLPGVLPRPDLAAIPLRAAAEILGLVAADLPDVLVSGVALNSSAVRAGDLFAAVPGEHAHGSQFVPEAIAAGATVVLTDPQGAGLLSGVCSVPVVSVPAVRSKLGELAALVYGHPAERLLTVGVTGTNGKTTTTFLLEAGMRAAGLRTALVGTVETRIGDERIQAVRTTPEAPDLQALLAVAVQRGVDALALEISSHALAQHRVDGLVVDVAVFTNLSQDHLDFHLTMDDYFAAKASLFTPARAHRGVVNLDSAWGRQLLELAEVECRTFSALGDPAADWRATDIAVGPLGSDLVVVGPAGQRIPLHVPLPAEFNIDNALAACAAAAAAGLDVEAVARGIAACRGVPGRMQRVAGPADVLAIVDYAHTPDAVELLLTNLRRVTKGQLVVVLGCGGERDRSKRPAMGAAAARLADVVVLTDDNPRGEDSATILEQMLAGIAELVDHGEILVNPDRDQAIRLAVNRTAPGDTVVVAGKGHEHGQEVRGQVRPFDDVSQLATALLARAAEIDARPISSALGHTS